MATAAKPKDHGLVLFEVRGARFAVPTDAVEEIADWEEARALPRAPAHIAGLVNLRSKALAALDIGEFLELRRAEGRTEVVAEDRRRLLVVSVDGYRVALMCERVWGVEAGYTQRPAASLGARLSRYADFEVDGSQGLSLLLDLERLLEDARVR